MTATPENGTNTELGKLPAAQLVNVSKQFPDFSLQQVSIDVFPGEVHVIVGENGSGKSTLMKLLTGWFPPDSGQILLGGQEIHLASIPEGQDSGLLYLHQDVHSFESLSIAENVYVGQLPRWRGIGVLFDRLRMVAQCRKVFTELEIDLDVQTPVRALGYAERQLITAVRAYVSNAQVIVFDEPTSAMNETDRDILFEIVDRLKADGRALFYISHRMDEIRRVGDRVTVLHDGQVVATRPCDEIDHDGLVRMMSGDVHRERYPRLERRPGPKVLQARNLVVDPILKGVTFNLRRGEILGITGLMGSGRSLLANCLFGIVTPESGEIEIDNVIVDFKHPSHAMSRGISLIPEDRAENGIFGRHDLVTNTTSASLSRFLKRYFLDERFMREVTSDYARELSIRPGNLNDLVETYSGGNQQKVLVARWLMHRSKIYIMDEPTRGIDVAARVDIYNAMNDLTTKGAGVILISSHIEEILGMCDRILVLAGGRIAAEMPWREASKEKILMYATTDT